MDLVGFSNKNISVLFSLDFGILSPKQKQTEGFAGTWFKKKKKKALSVSLIWGSDHTTVENKQYK